MPKMYVTKRDIVLCEECYPSVVVGISISPCEICGKIPALSKNLFPLFLQDACRAPWFVVRWAIKEDFHNYEDMFRKANTYEHACWCENYFRLDFREKTEQLAVAFNTTLEYMRSIVQYRPRLTGFLQYFQGDYGKNLDTLRSCYPFLIGEIFVPYNPVEYRRTLLSRRSSV